MKPLIIPMLHNFMPSELRSMAFTVPNLKSGAVNVSGTNSKCFPTWYPPKHPTDKKNSSSSPARSSLFSENNAESLADFRFLLKLYIAGPFYYVIILLY